MSWSSAPAPAGWLWRLACAGPLRPRIMVVATGYNGAPKAPDFPSLGSFQGLTLHSSDYRNASPFKDRRTLAVGCGNSGCVVTLNGNGQPQTRQLGMKRP